MTEWQQLYASALPAPDSLRLLRGSDGMRIVLGALTGNGTHLRLVAAPLASGEVGGEEILERALTVPSAITWDAALDPVTNAPMIARQVTDGARFTIALRSGVVEFGLGRPGESYHHPRFVRSIRGTLGVSATEETAGAMLFEPADWRAPQLLGTSAESLLIEDETERWHLRLAVGVLTASRADEPPRTLAEGVERFDAAPAESGFVWVASDAHALRIGQRDGTVSEVPGTWDAVAVAYDGGTCHVAALRGDAVYFGCPRNSTPVPSP